MKRLFILLMGLMFLAGCARAAGSGGRIASYTSRGQFIYKLIKAAQIEIKYFREPKIEEYFDDVKSGYPYSMELINAVDSGVLRVEDRKAKPDEKITLKEAKLLMDRAYEFKSKNSENVSDEIVNKIKGMEGDENMKDEDFVTEILEEKFISAFGERVKPFLRNNGGNLKVEDELQGINVTLSKDNGELVVTLDWGQKSTGGYILKILSIKEEGTQLVVEYFAKAPGPNDIVTQAITYPKDSKRIKVTDINRDYEVILKYNPNI